MTQSSTTLSPPSTAPWPVGRVALKLGAGDEETMRLTQSAIEAGALGGQVDGNSLILYLPRENEAAVRQAVETSIREETGALGWPDSQIEWDTLADAPWATAWQADFKALPIGERLLIRPDWEKGTAIAPDWQTREVIYIKPGGGFGTARHETTRLALELLEQFVVSGAEVLDFGAGSGILAIAAARLGAGKVLAVEADPQAIINAQENIEINGVQARVTLRESAEPAPEHPGFHLIICNMLPHEARPHWTTLAALLTPRAPQASDAAGSSPRICRLIYSGLLTDQRDEIEAELGRLGLHNHTWAEAGEWAAGVFGLGRG